MASATIRRARARRAAGPRARPPVAFLAWSTVAGRSWEIASALGGEAHCSNPSRLAGRRRLTPLRYLVNLADSAAYLARRRPRAVIATNPPVFPGIVAVAYSRVARVPFLLDSHPTAFGVKGNRQAQLMLPVHRWLARQAVATLVTTTDWVEKVDRWGGRGEVVHEAPGSWKAMAPPKRGDVLRVLCVNVFGQDEPVAEVVKAAGRQTVADLRITGSIRKAPAGLVDGAPPSAQFIGYLDQTGYRRAVRDAHALLCLTTEPTSIMRSACEAVWAGRPLIVSDFPALREAFPHAVHCSNDAADIARAVVEVGERYDELSAAAEAARDLQMARWEAQVATLQALIR